VLCKQRVNASNPIDRSTKRRQAVLNLAAILEIGGIVADIQTEETQHEQHRAVEIMVNAVPRGSLRGSCPSKTS